MTSYDADVARFVFQLAAAMASVAGTIIVVLLRRSVVQLDTALAQLGEKLDVINERIGAHAQQLAKGAAEIDELKRRTQELENEVRDIARHGCARMCQTPVPRG